MSTFDTPAISVGTKTNEQNMQITKGYLSELAGELNYQIDQINERLDALESALASLQEGDE